MGIDWWIGLSEIVRNFGLVAAAAVGIGLAAMRVLAANRQAEAALRQAEMARRQHVAELFNRAVGQLDDERLQVRLGAIYTLREIERDFPDLAGAVFELLSAYIRETSPRYGDQEPPPDVREIFATLRGRLE